MRRRGRPRWVGGKLVDTLLARQKTVIDQVAAEGDVVYLMPGQQVVDLRFAVVHAVLYGARHPRQHFQPRLVLAGQVGEYSFAAIAFEYFVFGHLILLRGPK